MEIGKVQETISMIFQKYKYTLLILIVGVIFMLWPQSDKVESENQVTDVQQEKQTVEEKLSSILSEIEGAGNVEVLLSVSYGEQIIYQTDDDMEIDGEKSQTNTKTVIIESENNAEEGLIKQIIPAKYLGAIVVCEGADSPSVRLAVVEAVSKVTGLSTNKISVLKMK